MVYIPYAHRLYIDTVRTLGLYRQTNHSKYVKNKFIDEKIFAKVIQITFEKHSNVRLTKLTLRLLEDKLETNYTFQVKFHDIDNVLDFIILRQTYDNSLCRNWKIGDSFRAIIEEKWWFGDIEAYNYTENSAKTQFQALKIVWGNGTQDILSYWDLEPIIGEVRQNKNISLDVSDEDRNNFYISDAKEWPVFGKVEECKRIVDGLTQVMELQEYKVLMDILNQSNSKYVTEVPYPINLSIVRSRVENLFYRRQAAIKYDIKLFLKLIVKALDPKGTKVILKNTRIILAVCLKFIDEHRARNIEHIYKKIMEDPEILDKIKYYSCVRPHLNPIANAFNPSIDYICEQLFNGSEGSMNILTPSTTRPIVGNTIRRFNDSKVSVIELSDSEEDNEVNDDNKDNKGSQLRTEEIVDQIEDYEVSPTASPLPIDLSIRSTEVPTISKSLSQPTSRPVVPEKGPIKERPTVIQQVNQSLND